MAVKALSSTNDTLVWEKSQGGVNDSGIVSAEQEVRSADVGGASALKSSDAFVVLAAVVAQKPMEMKGQTSLCYGVILKKFQKQARFNEKDQELYC
ncbi:hypothetical protein FXO37_29966 [Capsicum annuum]|nr:hypothetical protein FXO37_29966 [Capsicum annuum]